MTCLMSKTTHDNNSIISCIGTDITFKQINDLIGLFIKMNIFICKYLWFVVFAVSNRFVQ